MYDLKKFRKLLYLISISMLICIFLIGFSGTVKADDEEITVPVEETSSDGSLTSTGGEETGSDDETTSTVAEETSSDDGATSTDGSETVVSDENWKEWLKRDYWDWHTRTTTTDKAYNGEHIEMKDNAINFYGYGQFSYKDYLYKKYNSSGKKIFKFILDESKANYHTLEGAGFLLNSTLIDNKLSGYFLCFTEKKICLYELNNVDFNIFDTQKDTTIDKYAKLVKECNKTSEKTRNLTIEVTPQTIYITENGSVVFNSFLDSTVHNGNDFGLMASYKQHDCSKLSKIEFYQLDIILNNTYISIINSDKEGNPVVGSKYQIKDSSGNVVKTIELKESDYGLINVGELARGMYTIQQIYVPDGYVLNKNSYTFQINGDGYVVNTNEEDSSYIIILNDKGTSEVVEEEDNTRSSKIIPNTGDKKHIILISIVIVSLLGVVFRIKMK